MAETLSYNNTPEAEVLSSEEQDSLEVGEKLVAEQLTQLVKKTPELKDKFGANAIQGQALNNSESADDS